MIASKVQVKRLKIKPTTYLYLRRQDDQSIIERVKVAEYESVIPVKNVIERYLIATLARYRVYSKIWANRAGQLRITINGTSKGRRLKEVIHLPFFRRHWEQKFRGYADFQRVLRGIILSNLRRRGLRLSNPQESRERIDRLVRNKKGLEGALYMTRDEEAVRNLRSKISSVNDLIRLQKQTKQLMRATIRIEKLGKIEE